MNKPNGTTLNYQLKFNIQVAIFYLTFERYFVKKGEEIIKRQKVNSFADLT